MGETCVNLEERFGRRFRIGWEATGATKAQWLREEWPWLMELRCQRGKVYPWGGKLLQASTDRRRTGAQLRALSCVIHAKGDDETVIRFHVDQIGQVLAILKPYRRRQLSEAERERLRAVGFQRQAQESHCESEFRAPEATIAPPRATGTGGSHAV